MTDLRREVTARCPASTGVHADVQPAGEGFEAHVELRFPQHQVIVNAAASSADGAAREALARLGVELRRLQTRDPTPFRFDARQAA